jgi:hypothetical protein
VGVLIKASLLLIGTIFSLTGNICFANDAITVVANTQDRSILLNRQEVRNLFMGGAQHYGLHAIALPPENQTRILFNTKVIGLTESRIQSYWAQMRFTGRKKAPKEVDTERLVIQYIKDNEGTVGYLPASVSLPDELTVIYTGL